MMDLAFGGMTEMTPQLKTNKTLCPYGAKALHRRKPSSAQNQLPRPLRVGLLLCTIVLFIRAAGAQSVPLGQDVQRPIEGVGHDYIHGITETVNPATGNLSIKIDLPVPKSRGLTLPFSLSYNSGAVHNLRTFLTGYMTVDGTTLVNGDTVSAIPTEMSSGGWTDSFPYTALSTWTMPVAPPATSITATCTYSSSYAFYDPAGTSHVLGLAAESTTSATNVTPEVCSEVNNYQYHGIAQGGDSQISAASPSAAAPVECAGIPNGDPDCANGAPPFTVEDKFGTIYSFPGGYSSGGPAGTSYRAFVFPSSIEDRNGNILQVNAVPQSGMIGSNYSLAITDTAGRTFAAKQSSGGQSVSYNVGGLTYPISWTSTADKYTMPQSFVAPALQSGESCTLNTAVNGTVAGIQTITLPNGQYFTFKYDSTYGLVNEIDYPDGGWVKYTWGFNGGYNSFTSFDGVTMITPPPGEQTLLVTYNTATGYIDSLIPILNGGLPAVPIADRGACEYQYQTPVVLQRTVGYSPGSSAAQTQTFAYGTTWNGGATGTSWTQKQTTVTTTDNVTGYKSQSIYTYSPIYMPYDPDFTGAVDAFQAQIPVESSVAVYDWSNTVPSTNLIKTEYKTWYDQFEMYSDRNQWSNQLGTMNIYCYGAYGVVTEEDEYNSFGSVPQACNSTSAPRSTTYSYYGFAQPNLITTYAAGTQIAQTTAYYDGESATTTSPQPVATNVSISSALHDETNYGASSTAARGNLTTVIRSSNVGASPTTTFTYDQTGQVQTRIDACGNTSCLDMTGTSHKSSYSYADSFTELSGGANVSYTPTLSTDAYLTKITDPLGHTFSFKYDYNNGQLTSSTDPNSQITTYLYADSLNRPTQANTPDGGQTNIEYYDPVTGTNASPTVTTSTLLSTDGPSKVTIKTLDGMGHVTGTELESDPAGPIYTSTTYNGQGLVRQTTNPYRTTSDPTYGTITYLYDILGRKVRATNQDNTSTTWCYNAAPNVALAVCTGNLATSYSSSDPAVTWVDYYDELTIQHESVSDGFGRLIAVMEPNGSAKSPSMETDYSYDMLNNLLQVNQHGLSGNTARTRTFTYDTLSRLISANNSETGTVTYNYDANSNLATKTDNRSITTTYGYDVVNRPLSTTHSDAGTPTACFLYDSTSIAYGITRLASEWTQSPASGACSTTAATLTKRSIAGYNQVGAVLGDNQSTLAGSSIYSPVYTYDQAGNVLTATTGLPSGLTGAPTTPIKFTYGYDAADRLSNITSSLTEAISSKYPTTLFLANSETPAAYGPMGLTYAQYGVNSKTTLPTLIQTRTYDNRSRILSESDESTTGQLTAATGSTGSFTVTGAEQSSPQGTPGTGTISINSMPGGPESGIVTVNVGNASIQTSWSEGPSGSSPSSLATSIAASINQKGNLVTAVASGSNINLTATGVGTATNYAVSVTQSYTNGVPVSISAPSALTGGTGGALIYDTGTVALTIDSATLSVNYVQTSTPTSIAAALATAINTDFSSTVSASASAGTIALTSKITGSAANWNVSGAVTFNSSIFTAPSFATSGVNMTGGTDSTYGESPVYSYTIPSSGGYDADSNVKSITDSVNGTWSYSGYDTLNRLTAASSSAGYYSGAQLSWGYDAFGNRLSETVAGTPTVAMPTSSSYTVNANNQIASMTYDSAGDVINDNLNQYRYDAEGRLCASLTAGPVYTQYLYDAEGRRVAKGAIASTDWPAATATCAAPTSANTFAPNKVYILGLGGEQVSELAVSGTAVSWLNTNAYAGGKLLATYSGADTYFALNDALGTKRMLYSPDGLQTSFYSLPFGDGLSSSGNAPDASPLHFTGKERDTESSNDYFGARYYSSSIGRFMSPDDGTDQAATDPQGWNLYNYARNNPLANADLDGRECIVNANGSRTNGTAGGESCEDVDRNNAQHTASVVVNGNDDNDNGFEPGSLGAQVFGHAQNSTWKNASGVVNAATSAELAAASAFAPELLLEDTEILSLGLNEFGSWGSFSNAEIETVVESAAQATGKGSNAGRDALQSHAARSGPFNGMQKANPAQVIREILQKPARIVKTTSRAGNKYLDVFSSSGQGVRINAASGKFITFLSK